MAKRLTYYIMIGMLLGVLAGYVIHASYPVGDPTAATIADTLKLLSEVFLHLIKMIIAPLVFATIVTGIAGMGDSAALGRIGGRTVGWFVIASLISLTLGLFLVNVLQPGLGIVTSAAKPAAELAIGDFSLRHFVLEIFPESAIKAMGENKILQILVFSIFVGVAVSALRERATVIVRGCEALAEVMLQVTDYVMRFAPFAVFGAISSVIAANGLEVLWGYGRLLLDFYLGLALLWTLLIAVGGLFLGRRMISLLRYIREPAMITFSTASSEAALPKLFEQLDRFGVPRRISGFVLPLGYSFNLDGSMMYMSFATIFIAQAYGIHLGVTQQVAILLTLMISSKGIAGVPRASLVVIAATLNQFGLPLEGVALLMGIDTFLDMGRSATNILGNSVATAVITKWEGMLQPMRDPDAEPIHAPSETPEHGRKGLNLDPGQ
ncbi:MAG: dicarboxylate/amino acid:cation symporter [Novosphingobium sp.]